MLFSFIISTFVEWCHGFLEADLEFNCLAKFLTIVLFLIYLGIDSVNSYLLILFIFLCWSDFLFIS